MDHCSQDKKAEQEWLPDAGSLHQSSTDQPTVQFFSLQGPANGKRVLKYHLPNVIWRSCVEFRTSKIPSQPKITKLSVCDRSLIGFWFQIH